MTRNLKFVFVALLALAFCVVSPSSVECKTKEGEVRHHQSTHDFWWTPHHS